MNKKELAAKTGVVHATCCPHHGILPNFARAMSATGASIPALEKAMTPFNYVHNTTVHALEHMIFHHPQTLLTHEQAHEIAHHGYEAATIGFIAYSAAYYGPKLFRETKNQGQKLYNLITTRNN